MHAKPIRVISLVIAVCLLCAAAANTVIRDRQGRKLGEIVGLSNGKLEARDPLGHRLGTYDPKSDQTRDPLDRLLTKGNTLSALIVKAAEAKDAKARQKKR